MNLAVLRKQVPAPSMLYLIGQGSDDESHPQRAEAGRIAPGDDLPFRVEIWDETGEFVVLTLAMTASASIGYAAYYEATSQYPNRYITLRHKDRVVARRNAPPQ